MYCIYNDNRGLHAEREREGGRGREREREREDERDVVAYDMS